VRAGAEGFVGPAQRTVAAAAEGWRSAQGGTAQPQPQKKRRKKTQASARCQLQTQSQTWWKRSSQVVT
jgi:hypothetical protein